MKSLYKGIITLLALFSFGTPGAKAAELSDISDFWNKEPLALRERFDQASNNFHEDWVLSFADSLEALSRSTGKKAYLLSAAELRCHHYFNNRDQENFLKNSEQARELAKKLRYETDYFSEMTNAVSFFINLEQYTEAEKYANDLLSEGLRMKSPRGEDAGYFALGLLYQEIGNNQRAIANYKKCLECIESYTEDRTSYYAQVCGLIAYNYYEAKDYDRTIEYAQKSIDIDSDEDDSYAYMALAYYWKNDLDNFRQYASLHRSMGATSSSISFDYYYHFIGALLSAVDGRFEDSMEDISEFTEGMDRLILLAEYNRIKGDWKNAYEYSRQIQEANRTNDRALFYEEIERMDHALSNASLQNKLIRQLAVAVLAFCMVAFLLVLSFFIVRKNRKILGMKEKELDTAKRYHLLVENAPFGYSKARLIYDNEGNVKDYITIEVNGVLRRAINDAGASFGKSTILESYPESGHLMIEKVNQARANNLSYIRFSYHLKEFERYYETFLFLDDSDIIQIISINTTELVAARKELESTNRQLVKAKERAEKSDDIKTQFIQNMSHEIRTPLNAIVGFSQLLSLPDGFNSEEEKNLYSSHIKNNSDMLMMLIDDILDVADAENGSYRIVLEYASCNEICNNAIKTVEYRTPPGVVMKFTSEVDDSFTIKTDPRRIQQVIINYLTNACKHTTSGEICVHCSLSENPGMITFAVSDTGIGVPPEMAHDIFERFTKLDVFKQGAGLGLNICSTIAKKLGGEVRLDTSYTKGARFLFIIPHL